MVESWSKENGAFCWVRPRSQREGQSLGWGTKQALVPCCKVLECSQVWNGCTTGFLLTHPKREKKKKQPGRNIFLLVEVEWKVDGKK